MTSSNTQIVQFLQQEKRNLEQVVQTSQKSVERLSLYIETLTELYWASHQMTAEGGASRLNELLSACIMAVGATDGSISRLDEEANELEFLFVHGIVREQLVGYRLAVDLGVAGWVVQSGETVVIDDVHQDWRFSMQIDDQFSFSTYSMLCVPILDQGKPIGVIQWLNKQHAHSFDEADISLANILSDIAARVLASN